jgi:hypothetical protein
MAGEIVRIQNMPEFKAVMLALRNAPSGNALASVALAGILPIQNAAIIMAPYLSGTLKRSIHSEIKRADAFSAFVVTGTDVAYARRVEFGFDGVDSLGRTYHQAAQPYMRTAYDTHKSDAIGEVTEGLRSLIMAAT